MHLLKLVGASRSTFKIFTKVANIFIRSITSGMVLMIGITIRFIVMARNSRIAVRIYIKAVIIIIAVTINIDEIINITIQSRLIVRVIIKGVVNMEVFIIIRGTINIIIIFVSVKVIFMTKVIIMLLLLIKIIIIVIIIIIIIIILIIVIILIIINIISKSVIMIKG